MCILNKGSVNSIPEVKNMDKISVVVPCYNEEEALPVYYKEMCRVMDEMKDVVFELIFVDDGSSDATLGIMKDLNEKDSRCRYLSFSRNFGKEAAIYAGLKASEGDYVALMDVDLQDPPALLPEIYDCSDHSKDAGLGRSGIWLAVTCLYYFHGQWSTASLYRNCRGVSVKDLS